MSLTRGLAAVVLLACAAVLLPHRQPLSLAQQQDLRAKSMKLFQEGNFKDALAGFEKLCLDENSDGTKVGTDLNRAVDCLNRLQRVPEFDELMESTIKAHSDSPHLLMEAAALYQRATPYGMMVGNKFQRGRASWRWADGQRTRAGPRAGLAVAGAGDAVGPGGR